ncbi:hypothetical protein [Aeromonas salmonicida]
MMLKGLFKLPLRVLEGFINSSCQLMAAPLQSPASKNVPRPDSSGH